MVWPQGARRREAAYDDVRRDRGLSGLYQQRARENKSHTQALDTSAKEMRSALGTQKLKDTDSAQANRRSIGNHRTEDDVTPRTASSP
jgi:hypothetical protein